ncbi:LrgB family protein [Sporosarcina gallistercoris]|uniref:LrgB family protein n=1 Tax=Sporosarcina gallistercoris TaxID=2762245 RepID=A0ABR8PIN3_9BACL|nr:LrgB family protein [Sporosarcina gallistercoris]MBD7908052.1 LrgB family protein [Sporosarcina gallistercoris]
MQLIGITIGFILLTVVLYFLMNVVYVKFHFPFLVPILTTTVVLIIVLVVFHIPYDTYMIGGQWINQLLGPAVVALAIPLYKQRDLLKRQIYPIVIGVLVGCLSGMVSGVMLAKSAGFSKELVLSILPKSITTPIAMQITAQVGGIPALAAVFVIIAGISGVLLSHYFLTFFKLDSTLGRGIGLGVATHAIGTSKAIEYGEEEASLSSVAMTLAAIFGSILGPVIAWIFY